jgi:hypothetical protein
MAGKRGDVDDRELLMSPGRGVELVYFIRQFGCYASGLLVVIAWLLTAAVIAWQGWRVALWPFFAVPAISWVLVLGLPVFVRMWLALMALLDAIVQTAEAYAARAGWSIDINNDGVVGHRQPEIYPPVVEHRPIIVRGRVAEEHRALTAASYGDQARRAVGSGDVPGMESAEREPVRVKVWHLPNGERIREDDLLRFVDGIFIKGWSRETWVGERDGQLLREVYEGVIQLLEQAEIVDGRKKGFAGRLTVSAAWQVRDILDLPAPGEPG